MIRADFGGRLTFRCGAAICSDRGDGGSFCAAPGAKGIAGRGAPRSPAGKGKLAATRDIVNAWTEANYGPAIETLDVVA
jgi:hypothetical protein